MENWSSVKHALTDNVYSKQEQYQNAAQHDQQKTKKVKPAIWYYNFPLVYKP